MSTFEEGLASLVAISDRLGVEPRKSGDGVFASFSLDGSTFYCLDDILNAIIDRLDTP